MFANLISNAVKFTRERIPAVIEMGQMQVGGEPVMFVRYNGVGFDVNYCDKLFGIFNDCIVEVDSKSFEGALLRSSRNPSWRILVRKGIRELGRSLRRDLMASGRKFCERTSATT